VTVTSLFLLQLTKHTVIHIAYPLQDGQAELTRSADYNTPTARQVDLTCLSLSTVSTWRWAMQV